MSQLYFAFGSNMSSATLRERGVAAEMAGPALLRDHRLAFTLPSIRWTGRAADVLPAPGQEVWGVLWNLSDSNALDPFERRYHRVEFTVEQNGNGHAGPARRALGYIVRPELRAPDEAPPAPAYLRRMVEGATEAGLPHAYVDFLRSCGPA
ncbi:MAG: gamma-glutamylcyclotransferase family protein [Acidimicrobiia bacterium]|nr:gamma-glutamylcyclotransferase family protein [Acidimicrobiia bacterium]